MKTLNFDKLILNILITCLLIMAGCQNIIIAQNLVPNPSFEEMTKPPDYLGQLERAIGWFSPTIGDPELFSVMSEVSYVSVPLNIYGFQYPEDGVNYVAVGLMFNENIAGNPVNQNEYIAIKLLDKLKTNTKYCFNIYISCASFCCSWTVKDFGFLVSKQHPNTLPKFTNQSFIYAQPTWKNPEYLTNDTQWEQISAEFIADGGEEYITIGIFTDPLISDTIYTGIIPPGSPCYYFSTYYYLDMASLECCDQRVCDEVGIISPYASKITFNNLLSINELFEIKGAKAGSNLQIFNMSGQLVHETKQMQWSSSGAAKGMYFFRLKEPNGAMQHGKIVVQ